MQIILHHILMIAKEWKSSENLFVDPESDYRGEISTPDPKPPTQTDLTPAPPKKKINEP